MADFFVQKRNIGIESLRPMRSGSCVTETELNTQVNMLIASLEKVRREATRILEKNPGGISFKKPN